MELRQNQLTNEQSTQPTVTTAQNRSYAKNLTIVGSALLLLIIIIYASPWLRPYSYHGTMLQATNQVQNFTLETTTGSPMSINDFRGDYVLLYFGYTFCPDVCPTTLSDLQTMMAALGDRADDLQVIFISVDPARDTVEQLSTYLPHFDERFLGMTGTPDTVLQAATQFGIFYSIPEETDGYYTVDHTSTVVVVDANGYARLVFPYGVTGEEMADDMRHLMRSW